MRRGQVTTQKIAGASRTPAGPDPSPSIQFIGVIHDILSLRFVPSKPFTEFVSLACTTPQKQKKKRNGITVYDQRGRQGGHEFQDRLPLMEIDLLFLKRLSLSHFLSRHSPSVFTFARAYLHSFLGKLQQIDTATRKTALAGEGVPQNQLQML